MLSDQIKLVYRLLRTSNHYRAGEVASGTSVLANGHGAHAHIILPGFKPVGAAGGCVVYAASCLNRTDRHASQPGRVCLAAARAGR